MKLTDDERTDINICLTEIQTILENNLYEDTEEEQELLRERKELLHELKVN